MFGAYVFSFSGTLLFRPNKLDPQIHLSSSDPQPWAFYKGLTPRCTSVRTGAHTTSALVLSSPMVSGQLPNGGSLTRSLVGVASSAVEELKALGHWPLAHAHLSNTAKLLLLGPAIEACRRVFLWVMDRFRLSESPRSFCCASNADCEPRVLHLGPLRAG